MSPQLILAALLAVSGFIGGWTVNGWRYEAKEAQDAKQKLVAVQLSAAKDIRVLDNQIAAQNAAVVRQNALRRDADDARATADRVLHAADAAVAAAQANHAACLDRAAALADVFKTVTTERRELAAKADRHASDIQTLIDTVKAYNAEADVPGR